MSPTLSSNRPSPRTSCPMQCPKPHSAPRNVAFSCPRPTVKGVKACKHKCLEGLLSCGLEPVGSSVLARNRRQCSDSCLPNSLKLLATQRVFGIKHTTRHTARWSGPDSECKHPANSPAHALELKPEAPGQWESSVSAHPVDHRTAGRACQVSTFPGNRARCGLQRS